MLVFASFCTVVAVLELGLELRVALCLWLRPNKAEGNGTCLPEAYKSTWSTADISVFCPRI